MPPLKNLNKNSLLGKSKANTNTFASQHWAILQFHLPSLSSFQNTALWWLCFFSSERSVVLQDLLKSWRVVWWSIGLACWLIIHPCTRHSAHARYTGVPWVSPKLCLASRSQSFSLIIKWGTNRLAGSKLLVQPSRLWPHPLSSFPFHSQIPSRLPNHTPLFPECARGYPHLLCPGHRWKVMPLKPSLSPEVLLFSSKVL